MVDSKEFMMTLAAYKDNFMQKTEAATRLLAKLHYEWNLDTLSALYTEISQFNDLAEIAGDNELRHISSELQLVLENLSGKSALSEVEMCRIELYLQQLSSLLNLHVNTLTNDTEDDLDEKIVCLFDADLDWCKYFSIQLCNFGYKVKIFTETTLVSQIIDQTKFSSLIINVDLITPELMESLQKMRSIGLLANKAVVFISTSGEPQVRLEAVRLGGTAFFVKPFLTEEVVMHLDVKYHESKHEPRVLIVTNQSNDADFYEHVIKDHGVITQVEKEFIQINQALSEFLPDLILLDLAVTSYDPLELISIIRQQNRYESIPIVCLASKVTPIKQLEVLAAGADDLFAKETDSKYLVPMLVHYINRYKLFKLSMMWDELTRITNSRVLRQQLDVNLRFSSRLNAPLSIILIDIDGLDNINKQFGREAGDQVLRSLAISLRRRLRLSDVVGRYRDSRFMVILPNTTSEFAIKVIGEMRETFAQIKHDWNDVEMECSFSAGVAGYPHFRSVPELLQAAEQALSFAKTHGKNRTEVM